MEAGGANMLMTFLEAQMGAFVGQTLTANNVNYKVFVKIHSGERARERVSKNQKKTPDDNREEGESIHWLP